MKTKSPAPSLEELQAQVLMAPIPDLEPHIKRGALFVVLDDLNLAHTAQLMAENNSTAVKDYLAKGWLKKASESDLKKWKEEKAFFNFIIVQPFVVAKKFVQLKR